MTKPVVGVIGAGAMGAGIAQVAAAAGHPVLLYDNREGKAAEAAGQIRGALEKRVAAGKLDPSEAGAIARRIVPAETLDAMRSASVVIEAIVEQLSAKRDLLQSLEPHLAETCLIASNTSSLSITAMASVLRRPDRMLGLHFFNPVPAMKLVEVVASALTAPAMLDLATDLMHQWGKTPVRCSNSPGFIVNRIARPFYGEAFQLLEQRVATPSQIDLAIRGAGFRMGPCELMDLIGHDVNYAVTESVFNASYGDRRFLPSRLQRELVEAGLLGRKSGRGFYPDGNGPSPIVEAQRADETLVRSCVISGNHRGGPPLAATLVAAGVAAESRARDTGLTIQAIGHDRTTVSLTLTDGRPASQLSAISGDRSTGVFDWNLDGWAGKDVATAFSDGCPQEAKALAMDVLRKAGITPIVVGDVPGLVVARTLSMIVNEASDCVQQGICDESAADVAMRLGTNYPAGPFEWLSALGASSVAQVLGELAHHGSADRYRVSPYLLRKTWVQPPSA